MNLRDFKKEVEYFIGEFVYDCTLFIAINPHKSTDKMIDVQNAAIDLYNNMKDKENAKVEKDRKNWFAGLRKEMNEKLDALYKQISAIISEKDGEE